MKPSRKPIKGIRAEMVRKYGVMTYMMLLPTLMAERTATAMLMEKVMIIPTWA